MNTAPLHKIIEIAKAKGKAVSIVAKILLSVFILYRVFSLDVFPVLTSDSHAYLEKTVSKSFLSDPVSIVMPKNFKTAGYPLYLNLSYFVSGVVRTDPLTTAVFGQRVLLALSVFWLVLELGLASAPLAIFFSSGVFLAHSNFILTEGVTVPAGILFALSLWRLSEIQKEKKPGGRLRFCLLSVICGLCYLFLLLTKIPFSAFALLLAPLGLEVSFTKLKPRFGFRPAAALSAVLVGATIAYLLCVSIGNSRAFGRFSPSVGSDRIFYWGLWEEVFRDRPQNRKNPKLKKFFDRGSPYPFIHGSEKDCGGFGNFACSDPVQKKQALSLIEASGISLSKERLAAFFKGFFGVGKFELSGHRNKILAVNGDDSAIRRLHEQMNKRFMQYFEKGEIKIIHGFSKSKMGPEWVKAPQAALTAIMLLGFAVFAFMRKVEAFGFYTFSLVTYSIIIAAFAMLLIDLWRYIAPPFAIMSAMQCICMVDIVSKLKSRGGQTPNCDSK